MNNMHRERGAAVRRALIAVARLCAKDGTALRHDLIAVLAALNQPVPRLWLN